METRCYVPALLSAWTRAFIQRVDAHTQREIQDLAEQWDEIITATRPGTWSRLVDV